MDFKLYLENISNRVHFSDKKIEKLYDIPSYYLNINQCQKPKGIWYACNNSWEKFFNDEHNDAANFINIPNFKYIISIDTSKIIRLKSIEDIKDFNEKYGIEKKLMSNPSGGLRLPYDKVAFDRRFNRLKSGEPYDWKSYWHIAQREMKKGKSDEDVKKYLINYDYCMDWGKVAQEYSGIEICPYFEQNNLNILKDGYRVNLNWYNRWDVASGCIWEPSKAIVDYKNVN